MTERTATPGAPIWIELSSSDQARSIEFYSSLFGWTVLDPGEDFGGYRNFQRDGSMIAGCMINDPAADMPDFWLVYLSSTDASETVSRVNANGGQVALEPMDVTTLGTMAVVIDPGNAAVGVWKPGEHLGFEAFGATGAPGWFELHTNTFDKSVEFYEKVFGWSVEPRESPDPIRYVSLGKGNDALAGIMDSSSVEPAGHASHWVIYFQVDDCDNSVARVVELGGKVTHEPHDSPYGRLAGATDSTGAPFKLFSPLA
ncbi:MAG TPA: VOC family protein [Microthrixaceae bacterium]|nr:VOC family protein [Microthrixaceae bacterium]